MLKRLFFAALLILTLAAATFAATSSQLVIVQLNPGANITTIASSLSGTVVDSIGGGAYLLRVSAAVTTLPLGVKSIEYDGNGTLLGFLGSVAKLNSSWVGPDFYKSQPIGRLIEAPYAKFYSTGKGVVVADIDSIVDYSHPALKGHLTSGYDFVIGDITATGATLNQSTASFLDQSSASFLDQSTASFLDQSTASFLDQSTASFLDASNPAHGHGTLVAGIIAAWAPDAMIMPLRVFDDAGQADAWRIAKAIRYAVDHGADVINMSFGLSEPSALLQSAVDYAYSKNVVLVASAGNSNSHTRQFPAAYAHVMSIAATDLNDKKASFSNFGYSVFASAPGVNVIAPYPGGYYAVVSGTSFAAPIVAAEAALVLTRKADTVDGVQGSIENGTIDLDAKNPYYKDLLGKGRIDLFRSVK